MLLRKVSLLCFLGLLSAFAGADGFRQLDSEGRMTNYEGTMTVSGRFEHRQDAETLSWRGDRVCFYPDAAALAKLPQVSAGKNNPFFCFSNHRAALEKLQLAAVPAPGLCGEAGTATVAISRYIVESGKDVFDQAWLDRLEKQGSKTTLRCP